MPSRPHPSQAATPPASVSWGKYRKGWTERPLLAQTPDGPVKAILRSATSSRVPSLPQPGPARATLSRAGGAGPGADGEGRPTSPTHPPRPPQAELWPHSPVAKSAPAGRGGSQQQRQVPAAEAPSGLHATWHPNPELEKPAGAQKPWLCHHQPAGCHFSGLSAVGDRVR